MNHVCQDGNIATKKSSRDNGLVARLSYWQKVVNNYKHVRYYEGINDIEIPTTNGRQLIIALGRPLTEG